MLLENYHPGLPIFILLLILNHVAKLLAGIVRFHGALDPRLVYFTDFDRKQGKTVSLRLFEQVKRSFLFG